MHRPWKNDWPQTRKHLEGWWKRSDLVIGAWGTGLASNLQHATIYEPPAPDSLELRHTDPAYIAANTRYKMSQRVWPADILPAAWPHIGTVPLATYLGAIPEYAENNVWYHPCMSDICQELRFDPQNKHCRQLEAIVRQTVAAANGNYMVGMPALFGGIDVLAELRGAADLMMDMIEAPDAVHARLREIQVAYMQAFDRMYDIIKLEDGSMAFGYFMLWGPGKTGLCQCDTASMFSPAMFAEFVIPYLREQCAFLDHSMFHIDGSQCLAHLDLLLEIGDLDAIEYTPDPNSPGGGHRHWYELYGRILKAGKALWAANLSKHEVLPLLDAIGGRGVYVSVNGLTPADAEQLALAVEPYRTT